MKDVWDSLSENTIHSCFRVFGLTLDLDGGEDHAWCTHSFGDNYHEVLTEQCEAW